MRLSECCGLCAGTSSPKLGSCGHSFTYLMQLNPFSYYIPARDVFFVTDVVERVQYHYTSVDNSGSRAWVHARIFGNVGKWAI